MSISKDEEISALKLKVKELEAEKALFIESSYDGYWDWHIQDNYEYMSPRFWEIFGIDYRTKKHDPAEWQDIIHPEDLKTALKNFERHCESRGKHPYSQEVRYRHSDGSWVTVYCRGKVISWSDDGKPIRMVGTHTDITPLKRIQEELTKSNSYLEAFAYSASHDLQEPLRTMSNYSKYLLDNLGKNLDDDSKEDLTFIPDASLRMAKLVNSLLVFSRIGRSQETKTTIDTEELILTIQKDMQSLIEENGAQIKTKNVPNLYGIEPEFRSFFQNLISNALKYRSSDPPKITILGKETDESISISVSDNGCGIETKYINSIFEMFKRADKERAGTGLGLALCQKVARNHGGDVSVQSTPGSGSTFTLLIPKRVPEAPL